MFAGENLERNKVHYARIAELAIKHGCTPSQLALAWLFHQGDDVVPIPGKLFPYGILHFFFPLNKLFKSFCIMTHYISILSLFSMLVWQNWWIKLDLGSSYLTTICSKINFVWLNKNQFVHKPLINTTGSDDVWSFYCHHNLVQVQLSLWILTITSDLWLWSLIKRIRNQSLKQCQSIQSLVKDNCLTCINTAGSLQQHHPKTRIRQPHNSTHWNLWNVCRIHPSFLRCVSQKSLVECEWDYKIWASLDGFLL